jgi:hypothetical protein
VAHIPFDEGYPEVLGRTKTTALFMIRDPRDIAVSEAHYVVRHPEHPYHRRFAEVPDIRGRIALAIDGDHVIGLESIVDRLDRYEGWLRGPTLVVRFEDLVGPDGGGDLDRQRQLVEAIYRHLGVDARSELVEHACSRLFSSDSPTFHKGAIGGWRTQFDDELLEHFRTTVGDLAEHYGYLD